MMRHRMFPFACGQRGHPGGQRPAHRLGLALALLLTGCVSIPMQASPGTEERRAGAAQPSGPPVATVATHPDHEGWTVTVRQSVRRPVEVIRMVRTSYRDVYLNPLTVPIGFIGCTGGLSGLALTTILAPFAPTEKWQRLIDRTVDSCLMTLMINKSEAKQEHHRIVLERHDETESRPVIEGQVTLEWHGPRHLAVSYPLDADGRAIIRLHHLVTAIRQAGWPLDQAASSPIELVLWQADRRIVHWPVQVSPEALRATIRHERHPLAPPTRWPVPLVAHVLVEAPADGRRSLEARCIRTLLAQGVSVVAPEADHAALLHEIQTSLQGLVDDQAAVGPGHWLAPNVAVIVRVDRESQAISVTIDILNVRTREVLAALTVPAGPTEESVAMDVAFMETAEVIRAVVTSTHLDTTGRLR